MMRRRSGSMRGGPYQKVHHRCADPARRRPLAHQPDLVSERLLLLSPFPSIILVLGRERGSQRGRPVQAVQLSRGSECHRRGGRGQGGCQGKSGQARRNPSLPDDRGTGPGCRRPLLRQVEEGRWTLSSNHLEKKHKHHLFPLRLRAKGRQQGKSPSHEVHVKGGQEIYPDDVASVVFLRRQNICEEVVPVKEPLTSEHVQDVKDRRAVVENRPRHSTIPSGLIRLLVPIFQGQRWDLKGGGSDRRSRRRGQGGGKFLSLLRSLGQWKGRRRQRQGSNRHRLRHGRVRTLESSLRGHGRTNAKKDGGGKRSRRDDCVHLMHRGGGPRESAGRPSSTAWNAVAIIVCRDGGP